MHTVPIGADESCHNSSGLVELKDRYDVVNIKLDKCGGLTAALQMQRMALAQGYEIMVGCMVDTSWAMAPAMLLTTGARVVDLDGPLLLAADRRPGLEYRGTVIAPPRAELWGRIRSPATADTRAASPSRETLSDAPGGGALR